MLLVSSLEIQSVALQVLLLWPPVADAVMFVHLFAPFRTLGTAALQAQAPEAGEGRQGSGVGRPSHADDQGAEKTRLHGRDPQQVLRRHWRYQVGG